jgi:hypothetical protein
VFTACAGLGWELASRAARPSAGPGPGPPRGRVPLVGLPGGATRHVDACTDAKEPPRRNDEAPRDAPNARPATALRGGALMSGKTDRRDRVWKCQCHRCACFPVGSPCSGGVLFPTGEGSLVGSHDMPRPRVVRERVRGLVCAVDVHAPPKHVGHRVRVSGASVRVLALGTVGVRLLPRCRRPLPARHHCCLTSGPARHRDFGPYSDDGDPGVA